MRAALAATLVAAGLTFATPASPSPGQATVVPGAEWQVDTPASHGMDATVLDGARTYAMADGRNTQGVVVVHQGAIVAEWYAPGASKDSPAASWSVAKSFTSALIGIALDDGLIPSIDVPMSTYYPDWVGTPREAITLRDVLHMESGLDWVEDYSPSGAEESDIINMTVAEADQLAYAAGRPAKVPPGTDWSYSSGDTMLLSGVLQQATGMSVADYARQELLDPIAIGDLDWWQDAEGHTLTYCCIDTTSRDFARFGLLYLEGGKWGSNQVVPSAWVQDSLTDTANTYSGYGYQWWLYSNGAGAVPPFFAADGHNGQYIYVIPDLDLVVVRNGTYVKSPCPPIADPNLITYYPPDGLVPGQGTLGPEIGWSDEEFLTPIVESFTSPDAASDAAAAAAQDAPARAPISECPNLAQPATTTTAVTPTTAPVAPSGAVPVEGTPAYTG